MARKFRQLVTIENGDVLNDETNPPPASSSCPKAGKLSVLDRVSRLVGELLPKAFRPVLTSAWALVALTFGVAEQASAQGPGGAQPALVSIDLKGSNHYRCKNNSGVLLPQTEFAVLFQQGPQFIASAAKMGSTVDADITYSNPGTTPVNSTTVRAEYNGVTCGPTRTITFSPPLAPGTSRTVGTQIGPLPNQVDAGTVLILTAQTAIPLTLYLTLDSPLQRMVNPWVGVLHLACNWAKGKTTAAEVGHLVTRKLFDSGKCVYNGGAAANWLIDPPGSADLNLSGFLTAFGNSGSVLVDCRDVATVLTVMVESVGVRATPNAYYHKPAPSAYKIDTNPICAIGGDRLVNAHYGMRRWDFHCIVDVPTGVLDGCAAQRYHFGTADLYYDVPANWPRIGYWQTWQGQVCLGLVRFPGLSEPELIRSYSNFTVS